MAASSRPTRQPSHALNFTTTTTTTAFARMPPRSLSTVSNGEGVMSAPSTVSNDSRPKRPKPPGMNPKMEEFLKTWRQDALNKHQYDSAIFIGDKLLALTGMYVSLATFVFLRVDFAKATQRMRSGWRRSTLAPATTTVRRHFSPGMI